MTQTRTDNGSALGAGSVDNRYGIEISEINALKFRIGELEALIEQQKETILRLHAAAWY